MDMDMVCIIKTCPSDEGRADDSFGRRLGEGTTPTPSGTSLIGRGGGGKAKGSEGEDGECGDGSEYGGSNIASRSCCRRTGAGYAVSAIDSHCDAPGDA